MTAVAEAVIWHDLECGRYRADLPLWRELGAAAGGPILEIGAGTGRVALDLARRGHAVTAVEIDPELAGELVTRAAGLPVDVLCADITQQPDTGRHPLVIAPMQVIQVLGSERARLALLRHASGCLAPGGSVVVAFVDTVADRTFGRSELKHEDSLVLDGSRYTSRAVSVQFSRRAIQIVRERRTRDAAGGERRSRSHQSLAVLSRAQITAEAARAGLELARAHAVPGTDQDLGCVALAFRDGAESAAR
ncbi:MAG: class I SAM-dependent methyltransferase [Solirubrobacteraceae bacterium]|nr:class I SAM-dependent methyltransferase [Solirubrobacteraceae bacterium]